MVWPLFVSPVTVGAEVLAGGAGATTSLALESSVAAWPAPVAFVAVTRTRSLRPTSPDVIWKLLAVAPPMSVQSASFWASQLRHWYVKAIGGVPDQVPGSAVTVSASRSVPVIVGAAVFAGGSASTSEVAADSAAAESTPFEAVTRTRSVCPTSSGVAE